MADLNQDLSKFSYSSTSRRITGSGPSQGNWTNVTPDNDVVFSNPCSFLVVEDGVVSFRNAGNQEVFTSSVSLDAGTFLPCIADKLLSDTTATVVAIHSGELIEV